MRAQLEEAADWWMRIKDVDASPEEVSAWLEWMDAAPQHRDAYQRIQELGLRLSATGRGKEQSVPLWRRPLPLAAAIATVTIGASLLFVRFGVPSSPTLTMSTAVAAIEEAPLPDGSHISLGGATRVEARYTETSRDVRLEEGEAYFQVRPESARRPFVVNAGVVSIQVLGTAFNVRKTLNRVTVTVTEGKVRVKSNEQAAGVEARAGEQVTYDPATNCFRVVLVDTQRILGWREQRLEFTDEPLDVVIANINRHSPRHIEVRGVDLHEQSYTGTFNPATLDEWLIAVERAFPVRIRSQDNTIVVEGRGL